MKGKRDNIPHLNLKWLGSKLIFSIHNAHNSIYTDYLGINAILKG